MKDIIAKVTGLTATINFEDSQLFTGIRYTKTRSWDGEIVTTPVIEKVCKDMPDKISSKLGIGGLLWLHQSNPYVRALVTSIEPPRGPITEPLVVPPKITESPKWTVKGQERWYFFDALKACFNNCSGMIKLPTGSGKTEIELTLAHNQSLYLGAGVIIVPTLSIKEQFIERAKKYELHEVIDYEDVRSSGIISDNQIVITTPGVLLNDIKGKSNEIFNKIKWVIGDECHHAGCNTWYDIFIALPNAIRSHGFSALPVMPNEDAVTFSDLDIDDARTIAVMGEVIYQKSAKDLKEFLNIPYLVNLAYYWKEGYDGNDPHEIRKLIKENDDRNKFLSKLISFLIAKEYKSITFVSVKEHGKKILNLVNDEKCVAWFGSGKFITIDGTKLTSAECRAKFGTEYLNIIATSHAVEGLDLEDPINALAVHEERKVRRTLQRVGRIVRPDEKPAIVFNIVDMGVGVLTNQADCRAAGILDEFDCESYNVRSIKELNLLLIEIEKSYNNGE